ncbi:conserved hypothetical protein [Echinococcus multilocularis]|uniref:Uncharacterized protein n=2 Tax=Echinococcus TaxID=6209 RepID=A0A068WZX8_ECHGR|nr:hypothetical protein EgrG_001099900 [Echinococcus granulosus]CDS43258.1 conserved hypothetical protein [Echinococcus multilocularis]
MFRFSLLPFRMMYVRTLTGQWMVLAQPHDLSSGQLVTNDILPNVDAVLDQMHQVNHDGYYLGVNGQWTYHHNNCQCFPPPQ